MEQVPPEILEKIVIAALHIDMFSLRALRLTNKLCNKMTKAYHAILREQLQGVHAGDLRDFLRFLTDNSYSDTQLFCRAPIMLYHPHIKFEIGIKTAFIGFHMDDQLSGDGKFIVFVNMRIGGKRLSLRVGKFLKNIREPALNAALTVFPELAHRVQNG